MNRRLTCNVSVNKIITSMICGLVGINTMLCAEPQRPRLVVGIMIDQLRTDYIEGLQNLFTENGFRKLMNDGAYFKNVNFKTPGLDVASGTAVVYTGAHPRYTGVASAMVYDSEKKGMAAALNDPSTIGNFTTETYSPVPLRLSTFGDEIAVAGGGDALIYSIGPDAQQSVIMTGHAGNSAFWIDDNNGRWASSAYYRDNPRNISQRNYNNPLSDRLDTMQWKPLLELEKYPVAPRQKHTYAFNHKFSRLDRDVFRMYKQTPMVNDEITEIAIDYLKDLNIGRRDYVTDMLNIGYTVAPYKYTKDGNFLLELEDSYVRLDRQIARLLDAIERYVGLDNTLVCVASTGYYDDAVLDDPQYRIPTGDFSVKRALSLLNSFLSAKYGNGDYVDTYRNGHIFLDWKEIETKQLNHAEVARAARDFLVRMSGVSDAFTMNDIMSSSLPGMEAIRLATDPKTGGDVVLEFNAGWKVVDDTQFPYTSKVVRSSMELTPAFIMGAGIKPQIVDNGVDATAIAPTITHVLRIRSPNGAVSKPIPLSVKTNTGK